MVWPAALAGKLAFSLMVILAAFGYGGRIQYLKTVAVFYIVSFLMGGVTVGLMYVTGAPGLAANGSVYLHRRLGCRWRQVFSLHGFWETGWLTLFVESCRKKRFLPVWRWKFPGKNGNEGFCRYRKLPEGSGFRKTRGCAVLRPCGKKLMEEVAGAGEESLKTRICVIPYSTVGRKESCRG